MDRVTTVPVPSVNKQRAKFDLSSNVFTTFDAGVWFPVGEPIEVLPGDTFDLGALSITRMETFIKAPMDNLDMDLVAFYCKNKDVWEHFEEFFGENKTDEWTEGMTEYVIPQITAPTEVWGYKEWLVDSTTEGTFYTRSGTAPNFTYTAVTLPAAYNANTTYYKQLTGWDDSSIANYFGVPIGESDFSINHLPFRHYAQICNEWLRNQNAMKSAYLNKGDADTAGSNGSNYITDVIKGGRCFPAVKKPDFYVKSLPEPQKGSPALLPLAGTAPVITGENNSPSQIFTGDPLRYAFATTGQVITGGNYSVGIGDSGNFGVVGTSSRPANSVVPANLYADLSNVMAADVEDLRKTVAIQRYMERDALFGTRYREFLFGHFNVDVGAADMHIPEYLGGKTIPIHINAITQTSESGNTPQGNIAGMSVTQDGSELGFKTCLEHGFIIILGCVRIKQHTYQQGLRKLWSRKTKYDFYDPLFAGFGNQKISNREIFLQPDSVLGTSGNPVNDEAFAYQEYGADYRFSPNIVTGEMRDLSPRSQSLWHFADMYYKLPKYGSEWIVEDKSNIDNTLTVTSEQTHQFKALFRRVVFAVRTVTAYSIPGMGMAI